LPGESFGVPSPTCLVERRGNFDPTIMVLVRFSNGVCGRLMMDEFREEVPWRPIGQG
jgi:hypothetical protein